MIDWTKPVETVDGRIVRVLATDMGGAHPIAVAYVGNPPALVLYTECGRGWNADVSVRHITLLRNVRYSPVKRSGFVAVGKNAEEGYDIVSSGVFSTEDAVRRLMIEGNEQHWKYVARIEWEEVPNED